MCSCIVNIAAYARFSCYLYLRWPNEVVLNSRSVVVEKVIEMVVLDSGGSDGGGREL